MTEDEAKTKWCPFVRVTVTPNDATWQGNMLTNRGQIPAANTDTLCIASDCMAWRGEKVMTSRHLINGYCGLGGKT